MIIAGLVLLVGCNPGVDKESVDKETVDKESLNNGAWCTYWDEESKNALAEYNQYQKYILFACIYNEDNTIHIPQKLQELYEVYNKADRSGKEIYLSFVNDVIHTDGSVTQKSVDFLESTLRDKEKSQRLIEDMIEQAVSWQVDGIELDYENMQRCNNIWPEYIEFTKGLYERTRQAGLYLRVVLGSMALVEEYELIPGPEYVVMCYNLYGAHSGPGPKANEEFLIKMVEKFSKYKAVYALANGGFEWDEMGNVVKSLTAKEAGENAINNNASVIRDESGALVYTYDLDGKRHTVWYGDDKTIMQWREIINKHCSDKALYDLWRVE